MPSIRLLPSHHYLRPPSPCAMAPRKKRDKVMEWLSGLFPPKGGVRYTPDGPQRHPGPGGFFSYAQNVALNNTAITSVQGEHNTVTYVQGDRNIIPQIMSLLSQHIIRGAAHDSSARTPPPRCHPNTRVKLIARITAWFDGQGRQELVLWITGPAGVGKSAVVQTFAEYLVKVKLLGASVFFSRPNKRNNPHGVFITIAYQLATRIEAYRNFLVERLSLDPELLNGDMRSQFTTFIVEPFVEKKIGAGGRRWGILLDGLDELEGEDAQCEIIHLINTFAHEHPDAPLFWVIASRPESHISNTFDDDDVRHSCWSEYIPVDSTEACQDVERFLRSSFKAIQKKYRHSMSSNQWPSDTDFLKITAAASGLFIYAEVVMQFIRDPNLADPLSRLETLLSIIDRSNDTPQENPFVHLDALYHQILSSIPSNLWPTAKRLLHFLAGGRAFSKLLSVLSRNFGTLRAMSILFGLTPQVIYACLIKCRSTLGVPDWKVAHKEGLTILHASFSDYLMDSNRSGKFYVGSDEEIVDDVLLCLLKIWNLCSEGDIESVVPAWRQYCLKWDNKSPSRAITKFHANLFRSFCMVLSYNMDTMFLKQAEPPIHMQLRKVHMIMLSYYLDGEGAMWFVDRITAIRVNDTELLQRVHLQDLKFGHLGWKMMHPICAFWEIRRSSIDDWKLRRPRGKAELERFVSELESLQERSPELEVVICGGVPGGRVAVFRNALKDDAGPRDHQDFMYYIIPYPE